MHVQMYNAILTLTGTREHYAWNTLFTLRAYQQTYKLTNANAECNMQLICTNDNNNVRIMAQIPMGTQDGSNGENRQK